MTRLIVEEGGRRRAFKVGEGVVSVGTGESATLRLAAPGVADVHAEIEIRGGRARLRPRPGVVPPLVAGRPSPGEVELAHGVAVKIGSATLSVEYAEGPAAAAQGTAVRPAAAGRASAATAARAATAPSRSARGAPAARAPAGHERSRAQLSERSAVKPALVAVILALLGAAALFFVPKLLAEPPTIDPMVYVQKAEDLAAEDLADQAERELARLPAGLVLSPKEKERIQGVRESIAGVRERGKLLRHNMTGNEVLETQLKQFEQRYLQGVVERPKARVFLKRLRQFRERWPQHPELGWVERMHERFSAVVDLDSPPTYEDIEFEVTALTWANPRDYEQAFQLLDDFVAQAGAEERAKALELAEKKRQERQEWFDEAMQFARWEFERNQKGKSIAWLVRVIAYSGDPAMADAAAEELIKFEGLDEWLRGYLRSQPDMYERIARNPVVAKYASEHEIAAED